MKPGRVMSAKRVVPELPLITSSPPLRMAGAVASNLVPLSPSTPCPLSWVVRLRLPQPTRAWLAASYLACDLRNWANAFNVTSET